LDDAADAARREDAPVSDDLPVRMPEPETSLPVPANVAAILAAIMMLLALIGAGVTLANVAWAEKYWLTLVPVFGLICIAAAWTRTRTLDRTVTRQVLHWLAVAITIAVNFSFFRRSGEQTSVATGLSTLLILALGCLLAGVHLEWMFALVGLFLLAIAIMVSVAQEYMALALLVGAALIVIVLVGHHFAKKWLA
jgi:hypothetical protein